MRVFAVAADTIMGVILGLFLYAAVARAWPALSHPAAAAALIAASVALTLFRRPGGSLASGRGRHTPR